MKSLLLILLPVVTLQNPAPGSAEIERSATEAATEAVETLAADATPSALARGFFEALRDGEMRRAADYFDPASLVEFRDMMSPLFTISPEIAGPMIGMFLGEELSIEDAKAMDAKEFFARFLENTLIQASGLGQLNLDSFETLGELPEGEDLRHVVTRSKVSIGEFSIEQMEVVSFRATEEGWKMQLSGKMRGLGQQIQAQLGGLEAAEPE